MCLLGGSLAPASPRGQCMFVMCMMHGMHLEEMDMNLLLVLDALLATRSVTAAAGRLRLSQSATSHALARLRSLLGDALLVRGKGGLVPTSRAEQMAPGVRAAIAGLREAIAGPARFDPATAKRELVVGGADYSALVTFPPLLASLAELAPGIDVTMRSTGADPIVELLHGECDVAFAPVAPTNDKPGIHARALFDDRFVCIVRKDHPSLARRWTPESFAKLRHAFIAPRGRPGGAVDDALATAGLKRRVAVMLPQFLAAPFIVAQTDLVLTLPERVAMTFASSLPLAIVPPPLQVPGFTMAMLWHERTHDDPAHRWLRERILEVSPRAVSAARRATPAARGTARARPRARRSAS